MSAGIVTPPRNTHPVYCRSINMFRKTLRDLVLTVFSEIPFISVWHPFMTAKLKLKIPYVSLISGAHAL